MDVLALIFLILSIIGAILAGASIAVALSAKSKAKYAVYFFAVLSIMLFIGTLVNAIIGFAEYEPEWHDHHPCAWVALGLGIGAFVVGLLCIAGAFIVKKMKPAAPYYSFNEERGEEETNEDEEEEKGSDTAKTWVM